MDKMTGTFPLELTTVEAGKLLGCTDARIRQLIKEGRIRRWRRVGERVIVIPRGELDRLGPLPGSGNRTKKPRRKSA